MITPDFSLVVNKSYLKLSMIHKSANLDIKIEKLGIENRVKENRRNMY